MAEGTNYSGSFSFTEKEKEEFIYGLVDEFKASLAGTMTDSQKYAFIAGARYAIVTLSKGARE
ncbi:MULTISPECIES: hypothetical protein [unclassified Bradyrhizobium]|uniref:hypothetical protein n=1 Tax=unclassified Bradyrhizobium TaxID=2631580 RepID=UPI002479ED32|nr:MULTISPECIES: hypothetical protein [unclassified Bradyrhizobium]WGR74358.1 hypothetical protein MTX24_16670 [Bradyrhizobium sp. ISRA426]WGR79193.1 hypothetical protein MTX21_01785 [Bradyrhizobium sp. ISRA430]WGR90614.1 hypothetical protein MTX25_39595 [Bradyrhizobium sp. ISRA432]